LASAKPAKLLCVHAPMGNRFNRVALHMSSPSQCAGSTTCRAYGFMIFAHSHATQLLLAGVHPKIAQERLGHSAITTTLPGHALVEFAP
jgi:site-specific recombinase XerC